MGKEDGMQEIGGKGSLSKAVDRWEYRELQSFKKPKNEDRLGDDQRITVRLGRALTDRNPPPALETGPEQKKQKISKKKQQKPSL